MTTDVGAERGRVAVIGAGSIGLGWITLFLAHGYRVRVNSTRSNIETVIHDALRLFTPGLPGASRDPADLAGRLEIEPDLERAVADVAVVQENTPENLEIKQDLFARLEKHAAAGTLLLSSTSTM
ncbi:3-hydroxyacyl-CoA dehydrogenase NAD-binding domain-containing protein, partial [Frankia casuarinae]